MPDSSMDDQLASAGLLAEPVRRALYAYVVRQPEPVSRVAAADATGVPAHTAKFHLDKLVEDGLLTTEYRRLTGRSGPGAGRPAKLYRRSDRQVDITLPRRRYELAGQLLAAAVSRSAETGRPVLQCADDACREAGRSLGSAAAGGRGDELARVEATVAEHGYEPHRVGDDVQLTNCPFDALAAQHRELVCGMNLALLRGVLDGLGCQPATARLDPAAGRCCVVVGRAAAPPKP